MYQYDVEKLKWHERKWFLVTYFCIWLFWGLSLLGSQDIATLIVFVFLSLFLTKIYKGRKSGLKRIQEHQNNDKNIKAEHINNNIHKDAIKTQIHMYSQKKSSQMSKNVKKNQTVPVNFTYSKIRKLVSDFTVIDFETTGFSPMDDQIIQVAAVKYRNLNKISEFTMHVDPQVKIPQRITEITGITNEDVEGKLTIGEVLPPFLDYLEDDVLIAHNAPFDLKFLLAKMNSNGIDYRKFRVIDTLSLSRKHIDFTKNHKLETMKSFLKLNHLSSHEALHDCYVTGELYKYCYEESKVVQRA